jgi:AcrR family transcriptional regulator
MAEVQPISEWIDPRVRRTRQMLFEALLHLLQSKNIDQISVADIAGHARLNRATFYDHYPDKFALLEGLVESQFQQLLAKRNLVFDGSCPSALTGIALATCDFLGGAQCANHGQMEKHFEAALSVVLRGMLLSGLKKHPPPAALSPELVAATVAGAIYGAAREWVRTPKRIPAEEVVPSILKLVGPMLLAPPKRPAVRQQAFQSKK